MHGKYSEHSIMFNPTCIINDKKRQNQVLLITKIRPKNSIRTSWCLCRFGISLELKQADTPSCGCDHALLSSSEPGLIFSLQVELSGPGWRSKEPALDEHLSSLSYHLLFMRMVRTLCFAFGTLFPSPSFPSDGTRCRAAASTSLLEIWEKIDHHKLQHKPNRFID